jgi:NAD(P)-dependent dehydrogenase (short-subunit alcohol dehydrogenase family)
MDIRFDGKRALVTGAGKGIGRVIVKVLADNGATVVAVSRAQTDLDSLKQEVPCETITADLTDAEAARQTAEAAGDIDLLVNNAGIAILQPFLETTVEAFDQTMAVNVRAVMVMSQVIAKNMIDRQQPGAIVNVSSQASARALADHTTYCTSKAALDHLTRMMALELGPHGIRVNAINPTVVLTPMGKRAWSDPAKGGPMLARIPMGRFAESEDVAEAVAYLLSDHANMVHGMIMPLDGGYKVT